MITEEFPMTPSGKVQKFKLREWGERLIREGKVEKLAPSKKS